MATISADRVKESSTTTGTGSFTLAGAYMAYRAFSSVCSTNDTFYYCISHQTLAQWEIGFGTYSGSNTLARTTVIASSNSNALVNFSAGSKDVFIDIPAEAVYPIPSLTDGRLSLSSTVSCTTADITGATTIYYIPHRGNRISVYTGGRWKTFTFSSLSLALGTMTSGATYDVFVYDNAGTLTLEKLAWTNPTTRATAIDVTSGTYCKSGDATRKYLGTFYTTSTTTTEDSLSKRFLFNSFNQCHRCLRKQDANSTSWTYSTAAWRYANGDSNNKIQVVNGFTETVLMIELNVFANNTVFGGLYSGIGFDAATGTITQELLPAAFGYANISVPYTVFPGLGYHYFSWLEFGTGSGTQTWYGTAPGSFLDGLFASIHM